MENAWWYAGGAALVTMVASFWSQFKALVQNAVSRVIVTVEVQGQSAEAVTGYCWNSLSRSPFGKRFYYGFEEYVRPMHRREIVAAETIPDGVTLFWDGWRPIWVSASSLSKDFKLQPQAEHSVTLHYVRGVFHADSLVSNAVKQHNDIRAGTANVTIKRHSIAHAFGSSGKRELFRRDSEGPVAEAAPGSGAIEHLQFRLLDWRREEVGPLVTATDPLECLALSEDAEQVVQEAVRWKSSKEWYRERSLIWKRSWLFCGKPGTGKTALARAIAETLDLPVVAFDLASMLNEELSMAWRSLLRSAPAMALIEDIDTVFNGRENVAGNDLTFDCFLNCLDGVERSDGLLTVITTNKPETVDPALGVVTTTGVSSRPGRIDRVVCMESPDEAGRRKIAARILAGCREEVIEELVFFGDNLTGAQFEYQCGQRALQEYWNDRETQV